MTPLITRRCQPEGRYHYACKLIMKSLCRYFNAFMKKISAIVIREKRFLILHGSMLTHER